MKSAIKAVSLCVLFAGSIVWAKDKVILPDSCGGDSVIFKVNDNASHPPLPALEPGKALIVIGHARGLPCLGSERECSVTETRIGMDGNWIGALKYNKSDYLVYSVAPGEHHFCATFGAHRWLKNSENSGRIQTSTLTVEAGHIYYLEANDQVVARGNARLQSFSLDRLSDDDGKFMVKSRDYATSTPYK